MTNFRRLCPLCLRHYLATLEDLRHSRVCPDCRGPVTSVTSTPQASRAVPAGPFGPATRG